MQGISLGKLRLTGGFGISRILDFSMREYPGEHSTAEVTGTAEVPKGAVLEFLGQIKNSPVELYVDGVGRALYSGIIRRAESREENGYHLLRLELGSGSILMDLKKEKRSFQDISMTYGQVIRQTAEEAGTKVLCPEEMEEAVGFPLIQYRETDWEFIRRIASRFGLPLYPEPTMGGGKVCVGVPETGMRAPMPDMGYTARVDGKFYRAGGEHAGRVKQQYLSYEVKSPALFRVGDVAEWNGKALPVLARQARAKGGQLEFTYVLARKDWAWQKRLGNPKISGMSLLGTVEGCAGETVRLKLDIDEGRQGQPYYPWTWVPTTGNLMYMMPQAGTRVSLYFKGDEEESAIAVNCIRSGNGCAGADYRDKSLTTEHGMQMRLCRCDMGVVTLKEKVLLDDLNGIRIEGSGGLHVLAAGEVKIEGEDVKIEGAEGVTMYEGKAVVDLEGMMEAEGGAAQEEVAIEATGKVELSAEDGESEVNNRGENITYYLAWEHEDFSHPSFRFRDAPEQRNYDWMQLGVNVAGALMVVGGLAALASTGVGIAAEAGIVSAGSAGAGGAAASVGKTVFLTGAMYVGEQAVSDALNGEVSDMDKYIRKALAGSVVGFLSGATGLAMQGAGLKKTLALGLGEGLLGSAATQGILNEDGEINWVVAISEGMFSAVMAGVVWRSGNAEINIDKKNDKPVGFQYEHNPSDNPKVLRDAIEDSNAVYGYRPRQDGSLAAFANAKWDDPIAVECYRQDRIAYHNKNEGAAQQMVLSMTAEGASLEDIARAVNEYRNKSRINSYIDLNGEIKNIDGYNAALARAEKNSYENLILRGKTPEQIIKSATKGNPAMDACTGLYDKYFDTY